MPRFIALLLVLLLLAPIHTTAADDVIIFEPTPRLNVFRSKHYRIHTNLSRAETQPYGQHMDAVYAQYVRRFQGLGAKQVEPMPLYLFRTEQQYERFLAEHDIDARHSGGMFFVTHRVEGLATWTHRDSRRKTFEVLQHEGFHQFAWHAFGTRLPVWLNEGLAQYFEDAILVEGRMTLGLASSSKIRKIHWALEHRRAMPTRQLLSVSTDQWAKALLNNQDHASLLYAQAWSLSYFLIHGEGGAYKPKLMDYLQRISKGTPPNEAERMAFGAGGMAALDQAWRRFANQQQPDELTMATERLVFLGTGLRVLAEQGEVMPEDLDALRNTLVRYGFKLRQREMGLTQNLSADHDELYRFSSGSRGDRDFVLLAPDRAGLPSRITAPGLSPEPTLIWYRDSNGKLVQDIAYD